jgi:hypothetical protein
VLALEPEVIGFALVVEGVEFGRALSVGLGSGAEDFFEVVEEIVAAAVEIIEQGEEVGEILVEPPDEGIGIIRGGEDWLKAGQQAFEGKTRFVIEIEVEHREFQSMG